MDRKIMRRAAAIGVGLLLAGTVGATAQQTAGGYAWEPFQPFEAEDMHLLGVTTLPEGGLVVFGDQVDEGLVILTSADGGETWTETLLSSADDSVWAPLFAFHGRHEGEDTFSIAAHGDGLVAARTVPGKTRRTFILTSPDGVEWAIADKLKNVHVEGMLSTPDGLVMHGLEFRKAEGFKKELGGHPTLWRSPDGMEWETHEITRPIYKRGTDFRAFDRVVRSADGSWMALGGDLRFPKKGEPFVLYSIWTASDELNWTEVTPPTLNEGRQVFWRLFDTTPNGFLFGGGYLDRKRGAGEQGLWLTPDGEAWEQVWESDLTATLAPGPELTVATPSGVVAWSAPFVWTESSFDDGKSQTQAGSPMYRSSDGRTWEHDSATDVLEGVWPGAAHVMPDGRVLISGTDITECLGKPLFCAFGSDEPPVVLIGTPA